MTRPVAITATTLEKILGFLAPLFATGSCRGLLSAVLRQGWRLRRPVSEQ
jgi:hypothetical protein